MITKSKIKEIIREELQNILEENLKISKGHGRGQSWTNYDDDTYRMQVTKDANQYHIRIFKKFMGSSSKTILDLRGLRRADAGTIVQLAKKHGLVKDGGQDLSKRFTKDKKTGLY